MTEFEDRPTGVPLPDDLLETRDDAEAFHAPEEIGNYRVLRTLGEGGMGTVYEAQQDRPVRRRVALKIIKLGMDTQQVVRRFESERQALALMNHPNIARVFDAGATERGRPYFVMELVQGVPITEYCDRHQLDMRTRLELFIDVCDGVQHAHQKGIIHRDLKPSNVLVQERDGKHVPKIIDFGIAKATDHRLTEATVFTEMGQLIGTPEYLSPEQAEMGGVDIDTRADVYLLGVMLYELLTGALPFDASQLRTDGLNEFRRKILEDEPPRPSTRITTQGVDLEAMARRHATEPKAYRRLLRGDLDWITMKALEKDRTRRYASASELAADLGRYLRNEPVLASPPSNLYRLRKFVRRHRAGVAFAAMFLIMLIGLATTMTVQRIQIARARDQTQLERDRATREAATAREVSDFLESLFKVSDPTETLGNTITAREILDRGAERIERELADQPEVQGRLMRTMGQVYGSLGLVEDSRRLLERTVEVRQRHLGQEHLDVAGSLISLAALLANDFGEFDRARRLYEKALEIRRAELGDDHPDVAAVQNNLAVVLMSMGDYDGAATLYAQAFAIWERTLGPEHPDALAALNNRAALLKRRGDFDAARPLYERLLEIRRRTLGPVHPKVALTLTNLAGLLEEQGEHAAALRHYEQALATRERIFGPEHRLVAESLVAVARQQVRLGRTDEAERLHARAVEIHGKTNGFENPFVLFGEARYAALVEREDQALEHLRRAVDHGFADVDKLIGLEEFAALRDDERFEAVVARIRLGAGSP